MGQAQFRTDLSHADKKAVFKKSVRRVCLEVSSYCNRRCVFCPNASGIRLSRSLIGSGMTTELLESIVDSLQSIGFSDEILLHLYNEPMADPHLADKVRLISSKLPEATIAFNTNGDYLTKAALEELCEAGLTRMQVSLYGPNHGEYNEDYLEAAFQRVFKAVGEERPIKKSTQEMKSRVAFRHGEAVLPISIIAKDFNVVGYDRGMTVETETIRERTSPCSSLFNEFYIAWNGMVVPCCNLHPDEPDHQKYGLGTVARGDDMFDIFTSPQMIGWRRSMAKFGAFSEPCKSCTRGDFTDLADSEQASSFNRDAEAFMQPEQVHPAED